MSGLSNLAQLDAPPADGWWWHTLTSGPGLTLLGVALGCLAVLLLLGWRLRSVTAARRAASVRERLSDDSGVAMIEFVLVTPILLFTTLVLLQTALVFTGLFYVQYSAFAAARSAIVYIPANYGEAPNQIIPDRYSSSKFSAIESAAMIAVVPVSARESGGSAVTSDISNGVSQMYSSQGQSAPPWVEGMLAERLTYAMNHTEVTLYTMHTDPLRPTEKVVFRELQGLATVSPKEAITVKVRHEFALTVPVAAMIFTAKGESGSYTPASRDSESPSPPGSWTMIEARAVLTNEGISRELPERPEVPRY